MLDLKTAIEKIESHVRPATFPVAVRLLGPNETIPEKAKRPQRDLGVQITTCQGVTMARRYGWTVALTREDINCPLTKVAFGLENTPDYFTDGFCCAGMYTSSAEAGAKTEAQTHHLPQGKYSTILMLLRKMHQFSIPMFGCLWATLKKIDAKK